MRCARGRIDGALDALRPAGRARGVDHGVEAAADEGVVERLVGDSAASTVLVRAARATARRADHPAALVRPAELATARSTSSARSARREQHLGAGVGQHVGDLRPLQPVADRHQLRAELADGVEQLEPLDSRCAAPRRRRRRRRPRRRAARAPGGSRGWPARRRCAASRRRSAPACRATHARGAPAPARPSRRPCRFDMPAGAYRCRVRVGRHVCSRGTCGRGRCGAPPG